MVQVMFCVCRENLQPSGFWAGSSVVLVVRASDVQHPPSQLLHPTLGAASWLSDKIHLASTSHTHPSKQASQNAFRDRIHLLAEIYSTNLGARPWDFEPQVELNYQRGRGIMATAGASQVSLTSYFLTVS